MSGIRRYVFLILFLASSASAYAQDSLRSHFAVYAFGGPNFYYNNFQVFKNSVNSIHYTLGARFMWEPQYRLSLGINTGYYKIYTANVQGASASADFQMVAVPIQLMMKMDLYKGVYAFYSMGPSLCYNTITTSNGGEFHGSFVSLADISIAIGFQQKLKNKRFTLGGEWNFFHSSKSKENMFSMMVVGGYRL